MLNKPLNNQPIAVIGMAIRAPGADTLDKFWHNIVSARDCLIRSDMHDLRSSDTARSDLANPHFVAVSSGLKEAQSFDADYFGMNALEAERTDPSHRMFLECSVEALENANIRPDQPGLVTGVFGGAESDYRLTNLPHVERLVERDNNLPVIVGNEIDFLASRVSHKLKLTGPSISVMAACATSLMATHLAIASLRRGECDVAIAGGASIRYPDELGYFAGIDGMFSAIGQVRPFDADADGTVFGIGAGVVILKSLDAALDSGDRIFAVIRGSATTNDGDPASKMSFLAPSVEGQCTTIESALEDASISPDQIGYVETHGTGTRLGDPIEIEALSRVYRRFSSQPGFCCLGSVKGNIGHLKAAAGIASLIKTCLILHHRCKPPMANYAKPNPRIDLNNGPFRIETVASDWEDDAIPRAAVSSFGFGGTNVHMVLESAPEQSRYGIAKLEANHLLVVSAATQPALNRRIEDIDRYLDINKNVSLQDLAYTLQVGRMDGPLRTIAQIESQCTPRFSKLFNQDAAVRSRTRKTVFLFPGQGAQFIHMGRELYSQPGVFHDEVDACCKELESHHHFDFKSIVFGDDADPHQLQQTHHAQPALFVVEYALARELQSLGIEPDVLLGHSLGEIVAACIAGVFSLEDALAIVVARGRLMQSCDPGSMLAVRTGRNQVDQILPKGLEVAAINGPELCVVSGSDDEITSFAKFLEKENIASRMLETSHAFHSRMMEPAMSEFRSLLSTVGMYAPSISILSNLGGNPLTPEQAVSPDYWVEHIRKPVMFSPGIRQLGDLDGFLFLEIGPGSTLTDFVRQHDRKAKTIAAMPPRKRRDEETEVDAISLLSRAWLEGAKINWTSHYQTPPARRLDLPTYPFQHKTYWIEPGAEETRAKNALDLYRISWESSALTGKGLESARAILWLVLDDDLPLARKLFNKLVIAGENVVRVVPGDTHCFESPELGIARPGVADDIEAILERAQKNINQDSMEVRVANFWPIGDISGENGSIETFVEANRRGFLTGQSLIQAVYRLGLQAGFRLATFVDGLYRIEGENHTIFAEKAGIEGIVRCVPLELPEIRVKLVDISDGGGEEDGEWQARACLQEISTNNDDDVVALRADGRFLQSLQLMPELSQSRPRLRPGGVVFITGGVGDIALEVAKDLFRQHGARLVLTTRWSVPEAAEWQERIDEGGKIGNALRTVRDLTAEGAEIELVQADCTDFQSLAAAVKAGENRFGEVNAVVHAANASRVYLVLEVTREEEERSFAVKVHGALHLEALFAERFLDFMIHFSSQASIAPNPGQSAYSGANAILNALAERRRNAGLGFACAIGWGAWEQIGMAESLAASKIEGNKRDDNSRITPSTAGGLDHPLLSHRQMVSDSNEVFTAWLAPGTNRLIDSHTFRGRRLVAGVVIIECMRAAAALRLGADTGIELYNVVFLRPLFVENTGCEMLINVGQTNDELLISVTARSNDESGEETVHSQAQARLIDSGAPRMRCELPGPFDAFKLMDFRGEYISDQGDWACECADLCSDSTWSRTRIPEGRDGWDDYGIYPPLLDHAILSQMAVKRPDVVPQSVDRIRFLGPVGKQITVHGSGSGSDVQYIDASCFNDAGELILEVSGWSLKAVESSAMVERTSDTSSATNTVVPNRRLTVSRLGEFDSIGLESANISSPRPDEIQVQIVAAGLNFRDVLAVLGQLPSTEVGIDEIGSECSGYVTAVGNSVTQFKVGDAVMGSGNGLFADFANINEKVAVHIPEGIIMEHAAGIIGVFCTAEYALNRLAQLRRGEKVLIHAGAGGVGLAAIQLALNTGAEVYATAGSEAKKQYLLNLGVRHVASSRSLDFADEIRAQAGSLDVILNSLSGDFITESLGLLRRHGRFIEIGKKDILNNSRIGLLAMRDNLSFSVLDVGVMFADFEDEILDCLERVRIGFADGSLNVLPTEVIDIDKASEGFRRMSRGKHTGKIVFSVGGHSDPWRASALSFFKHFGRGISISAGQEIFSRLLSADALPSTVVAVAPGADVFGHQKDPKQPRDKAVTHAAEDAPTANAELNRHQAFLVDLWCKVSGIDDIKIEDDFFNLGGDSIMAIQIQYAIAREYDCNVSASLVSDFRTIDAMAEYLETI